jgi:serine/threonine protein kinase
LGITLQENAVVADRFRLMRMIGRGGMGSVWQAHDVRLDISCAVKFIEGELANIAEAHSRFEREAKAAAALKSPHVVEIKDHGVWQGTPYIAMELLEGEDLGKAIAKAGGKLPPAQVSFVMEQVCRALSKAHQAGIVHRDLKPDNIFLVTDDDRQIVKILDFGVAKQTSQTIDGSNTKTGAMLGTPYYMSPEQAQGIKTVDSRSDLWSLAVIVYQCITGRLPFESEALGDLLVKIIVQAIPVPSQVAVVPAGFDTWWAKAAERNPDARFPTAKEFAASLSLALGTSSLSERHSQPNITVQNLRGTAVMSQSGAPFGATPNPYSAGAPAINTATAGLATTPHPANPTPPGMVMGGHSNHPSGGIGANPATFSGVEAMPPKKGPPIAIIAVGALLVLVGLGGAGFAVARRSAATTSPEPSASTLPSAAPTVASATPPASAEPPSPVEKTTPPDPPPPAESASAAVASATPTPHSTPTGQKPVGTKPAAPPPAKSAVAAPTASAKKKADLGF